VNSGKCDLCGLPLRFGNHWDTIDRQTFHFCCAGCRMVFSMLIEAADSPDPARFKETDLYRHCMAAGVVPADEADLGRANRKADTTSSTRSGSDTRVLAMQAKISGMWCPACSWVIHTALERMDGVFEAACDFATDRLNCRYDPTRIDPAAITRAIGDLGFEITGLHNAATRYGQQRAFIRLVVSALLSANVMMLSWALYSGFFTALDTSDIHFISIPILVMATIVVLYGGGPLFRKAWWGLRSGSPGMETLVCLGAGSAYLYSLVNFWMGSWHLYFDTAAMLITLVLLGKMLEAKTKRNVRRDLESFLAMQPNKVRICSSRYPHGRFAAIDHLKAGDQFRVKTDEIVPADGRLISGKALMDTSAVTGESRPQTVEIGDNIISGTRLLKGDVTVTARKVGSNSLLGEMIEIIERGLSRQTEIQNRTDRYLALFVPLMAGLAAVTIIAGYTLGLTWEQSFIRGLTVLVIACPCALGIAIPMAHIAGLTMAGRKGILIRDFAAFETIGRVDSVVMDKTGTLTTGKWSLTQVTVHTDMQAAQVMALAAGLEKTAEHAVASSILAYCRQHGILPAEIADIAIEDKGIRGRFESRPVKIGAWDFASDGQPANLHIKPETTFHSQVYLSLDHQVVATLRFSDQLRHSARQLIQELKKAGMSLFLVSGDADTSTQAVAAEVDIEQAHGDLLPQDKAQFIERLQADGNCVAVMGDGINDAPALAQSDLSIALHHDSALAQQAAEVTLMQGEPVQFVSFMRLGRRVNQKVVQNLGCAWIYNLVSIPIAMSGLLNPLVAVSAMLLSSLTVIGNTLLLVRKDDSFHEP
jgi:heavy metal translocating P-type ATPase